MKRNEVISLIIDYRFPKEINCFFGLCKNICSFEEQSDQRQKGKSKVLSCSTFTEQLFYSRTCGVRLAFMHLTSGTIMIILSWNTCRKSVKRVEAVRLFAMDITGGGRA
jgi:hypothetical protein